MRSLWFDEAAAGGGERCRAVATARRARGVAPSHPSLSANTNQRLMSSPCPVGAKQASIHMPYGSPINGKSAARRGVQPFSLAI